MKHIKFLDGLRGIAALLVVISHCAGSSLLGSDAYFEQSPWGVRIWSYIGSLPVPLFIVLSGIVLTLPVASRGSMSSVREFYGRRALRILPAYYVALLLSTFVAWRITGDLQADSWGEWLQSFSMHALLLQDFMREDQMFNAPLWSIAVEVHLYALFPLLAAAWFRWGVLRTSAVAMLLSYTAWYLAPADRAYEWRFDLYALFVAGTVIGWSTVGQGERWQQLRALPWSWLRNVMAVGFAVLCVTSFYAPFYHARNGGWIVGAWAAVTIMALLHQMPDKVHSILSSRAAVSLGSFSYSLYLIHWIPLRLAVTHLAEPCREWPQTAFFALLVAVVVPISLLGAYLFHLCFERPFLRRRGGVKRETVEGARSGRLPLNHRIGAF